MKIPDQQTALFFKVLLWILHRCGIPPIVCLCGSTRFYQAFHDVNVQETLAGKIVLSIGCDTKSDTDLLSASPNEMDAIKARLDWLHQRKIDLADEIYVLNVSGYVGCSTQREIDHARRRWKRIRWLEERLS